MTEIESIKTKLMISTDIAIIAHRNPDGDALGSSIALQLLLEKLHHQVKVVMPSEHPNNFNFLPRVDDIIVFDQEHDKAREALTKANIIFCLDFNGLDRVDKLGITIEDSKAFKVMIDHHIDPEPFVDCMISDSSASSTCEMVYDFITDLGHNDKIDPIIGECLMTGIITDTGSFKYNTNPHVYQISGELKAKGVDDYRLNDLIYNTMTEKQLRILGHCFSQRFEVVPEYQTGIIALTKEDFATFDIQRGDTEGIVNYVLMMKGINMAAFIREQPSIVKLSLRSKGDISVQELSRKHFKGGGHKNASGGAAYMKLEDVVNKLKRVLPEFIKKV